MNQNIKAVASRIPKKPPLPSVENIKYEGTRFWFGAEDCDWYMLEVSSSDITGIVVHIDGLEVQTKTHTEIWKNNWNDSEPYKFAFAYEV